MTSTGVTVMCVDPGYTGKKIITNSFERVKILADNIYHRELAVEIEAEGNINVRNAAFLTNSGASILVLGTSSIFKGGDLAQALQEFRGAVSAERALI